MNNTSTLSEINTINKAIAAYIKCVLETNEQICEFVPNTHIADIFNDVLKYSILESKNEYLFHNVKHNPYDSIGSNNPDDYDLMKDGRFIKKETYSVGINNLLIPVYFDLERLTKFGTTEIYKTYQKLREKKDLVRNNILLGGIELKYLISN